MYRKDFDAVFTVENRYEFSGTAAQNDIELEHAG
jgi:hypothetical protein